MSVKTSIKSGIKNILDVVMPSGVTLSTPLKNLSFKLSARFIGYRNFSTSKHNALWVSCLQNLKDKVFFDVGAHIGLYTIPASKIAKRIISFEPSQNNLKALSRHLQLNRVGANVQIEAIAVSNSTGSLEFFESTFGSHPKNSLLQSPELGITRTVQTTTLDEYSQKNQVFPDVIKIDVEGAEFLVLQGSKNLLINNRPLVFLSLHPVQIQLFGFDLKWLSSFLSEINYDIVPENFYTLDCLQEVMLVPKKIIK